MPEPSTDDVIETTHMSFGDHLEELRRRVIRALVGVVIATVLCFKYGGHIIETLAAPYVAVMDGLGLDARLVQLNPSEAFVEYFKISLKFGLLFSAPWVLFQIWRFVATGLHASERRVVRYFAPASILLFVTGAAFMLTVVLIGLMEFLIGVTMNWFPLPNPETNWLARMLAPDVGSAVVSSQPAQTPLSIPVLTGEPSELPAVPGHGYIWIDPAASQLKFDVDGTRYALRIEEVGKRQFVQPLFDVKEYLSFVINLALAFGLGFQIPIVVIFLVAMRIFEARALAGARKFVILGVVILAAFLTPTPDVGTMMLLALPMIALFEIGLLIARIMERRRKPFDSP